MTDIQNTNSTVADLQYVSGERFEDVFSAEKAFIDARRDRASALWSGIALSGGGIRSAIFCLGALRALAEKGVLSSVDYMSSVSGGGYTAAALSWWWHVDSTSGTGDKDFPFGTPAAYSEKGQKRLDYLKSHGDYLTPDEVVSIWAMTAVVLRTLFLNLFVWIPVGAAAIATFIFLFDFLGDTKVASLIPNVFEPVVKAAWNQPQSRPWAIELFFGFCTDAALLILTIGAGWAIVMSLDTRVSTRLQTPNAQRVVPYLWLCVFLSAGLGIYLYVTIWRHMLIGSIILFATLICLAVICIFFIILLILQTRRGSLSANYTWRRNFEAAASRWLPWVTISFAVGLLPVLPYILVVYHFGPVAKTLTAIIGVLSGILSALAGQNAQAQRKPLGDTSRWLVMVASALFIFALGEASYLLAYALKEPSVFFPGENDSDVWVRSAIIVLMCVSTITMMRTNVNYAGLHRFYRDRLMEAFMPDQAHVYSDLVAASPKADVLMMTDLMPLPTAATKRQLPFPIFNTNAILINDQERRVAWRGGDNFIISPLYVGCKATGWERTEKHISKHGPMTLPTAMAASGAALNAHAAYAGAGVTRDRLLSIVLTLLNLRLGIWVGRPASNDTGFMNSQPNYLNPGLTYGLTRRGYRRESQFTELSDGGHFDNLGIYELIRRELSIVVALDGEHDPAFALPALYSISQRVKEDFGAEIELDGRLDALMPNVGTGYPDQAKYSELPFFVAPIRYCNGANGSLIYIKLSLVSSISYKARGYLAGNPEFPFQSTADQFFTPEQVEAYLAIGYENAIIALSELCIDGSLVDGAALSAYFDSKFAERQKRSTG